MLTNDNSVTLLNSERFLWLVDNLNTNEYNVLHLYMKEEVLPTVVRLEKIIDKQKR